MILKYIITFLRSYWYLPLIFILAIATYIFARKSQSAKKAIELLSISIDSYKTEMRIIKEERELEKTRIKEINVLYKETLVKLKEQHEEKFEVLEKEKKKDVKKYIEMNYNNKEELIKLMEGRYGIKYTKEFN